MPQTSSEKKSFQCEACGAEASYSAEHQSLKCDFCGKITQILQDNQVIPLNCDYVIPLILTDRVLEICTFEYMSSGDYTRDDLIERSKILKVHKIYAPFFRFEGQYNGTWTASFGYNRKETYTDYEKDSNGFTRPVTKTRTVTDWAPVSGMLNGTFDLAGYAGSELQNEVAKFIEQDLNLENATSEPVNFVAGLEVENISQPMKSVFNSRVNSRYEETVQEEALSNAQGDEQRDWTWKANCTYEASSVLAPVCHIVFEYEEKEYNVWIDGSSPSRTMGDPLPTDEKRQNSVYFGFLPVILAVIGTCVFWGFFSDQRVLSGHPYLWCIGIISVAAIYGFVRKTALLGYSAQARNAILSFQKASLTNLSLQSEDEQKMIAGSFVKPERSVFSSTNNLISMIASFVVIACFSVLVSVARDDNFDFGSAPRSAVQGTPSPSSANSVASSSNRDLCFGALDSFKVKWDSGSNYQASVREAERRGLSINECRVYLGLSAINANTSSPSTTLSPSTAQSNYSNEDLCRRALDGTKTNWDSGIAYQDSVREAVRRNLTVNDCRRFIGVASNNANANSLQPPSSLYSGTSSDRVNPYRTKPPLEVCNDALNESQSDWDPSFKDAVAEAQRRGMTVTSCYQLTRSTVGSQSQAYNNQPVRILASAPKLPCDELAANPTDASRLSGLNGTPFAELRRQADSAIMSCRQAVQQFPAELRFKYQLARSLQFSDRTAAFELLRQLVSAGYPAAFDNLGWMYFRDQSNSTEALNLFMWGAQRRDPDSIVSLAEMIDKNILSVIDRQAAKIGLYQLASEVGHYNAQRVLQNEIQKFPRSLNQREIDGFRDEVRAFIIAYRRR